MTNAKRKKKDSSHNERQSLTRSSKELGLTEYWVEREVIENPASRSIAMPFAWHCTSARRV